MLLSGHDIGLWRQDRQFFEQQTTWQSKQSIEKEEMSGRHMIPLLSAHSQWWWWLHSIRAHTDFRLLLLIDDDKER